MYAYEDFKNTQKELKKLTNLKLNIPSEEIIDNIKDFLIKIRNFDYNLYKHCIGVSILSGFIGKELGLDEDDVNDLFIAGALHDIGKIHIPIDILNKPDRLNDNDWIIIASHPAFSSYMIQKEEFGRKSKEICNHNLLKMIEQHHEAIDGTGYPHQLTGKQICLGAKIISIADKVEAYSSKRVYHDERDIKETVKFLKREIANSQIDKSIANVLIEAIDEKNEEK